MPTITKKEQTESLESFSASILKLKTQEEILLLFKEIMTPSEVVTLSLRWRLLQMLAAGQSQRSIASDLGISLCKITRGSKILKQKSLTKKLINKEG